MIEIILFNPIVIIVLCILNIISVHIAAGKLNIETKLSKDMSLKNPMFLMSLFMFVMYEELFFRQFMGTLTQNIYIKSTIFSFVHCFNYYLVKNIKVISIQVIKCFILGLYLEHMNTILKQWLFHLFFNIITMIYGVSYLYITSKNNLLKEDELFCDNTNYVMIPKRRYSFDSKREYNSIYKDISKNPKYKDIIQMNNIYKKIINQRNK